MNDGIPVMKSIAETAALFGISQHLCRMLALSGKVKAVRTGGRNSKILVNVGSLAEYFDTVSISDDADASGSDVLRPIPVKIGR